MGKQRNKRQRRAKSHRLFSLASVNTGPNKEGMAALYQRPQETWSIPVPTTKAIDLGVWKEHVSWMESEFHALNRTLSKVWCGEVRMCGKTEYQFVSLEDGKRTKLRMYFSGQEFFFIRYDLVHNIFSRSILYSARDIAMQAYTRNRIIWVERMEVTAET